MSQAQHYSYCWWFEASRKWHSKWKRVHSSEVEQYAAAAAEKGHDAYTSIQTYSSVVEKEGEHHRAPLYFDLDSADDLSKALYETKKIVGFFADMGVSQEHIRVWFSGNKGFHITVCPEVFDMQPSEYLTLQIKLAAQYLKDFLVAKTLDMAVYSIKRVWRLPDSKHSASGLYCVELLHSELTTIPEIKELAKAPRGPMYEEMEYDNIEPTSTAAAWWKRFVTQHEEHEASKKLAPAPVLDITQDGHPPCVEDLLANGLRKSGTRNQATIVLASYYKNIGKTLREAQDLVCSWSANIPDHLTSAKGSVRTASTMSAVAAVYDSDAYYFGCQFIRALGKGSDEPIDCVGAKCAHVPQDKQEMKEALNLSLGEALKATYVGHVVRFPALVLGKAPEPFIVPIQAKIECEPDPGRKNSVCKKCKLCKKGGDVTKSIAETDPVLVEMTRATTKTHIEIFRRKSGIPHRCSSACIRFLEYTNIHEAKLIPEINFSADKVAERHDIIQRRIFKVGEDIEANRAYDFTGVPAPHPRDSKGVHLCWHAEPKEMQIDTFSMTPELHEELKIFQPGELSVEEKFKEIHDDLEKNVHRIWGRYEVGVGIDLTYHSMLSFYFNNSLVERGWVQHILLGDSGQAKTMLVRTIQKHYNFGTFVNCESSGRTGILYTLPKVADGEFCMKWGDIPLNDRMLVIADEIQKLHEETVSEMGTARESGILRVSKAVTGETRTRTRMIMMCNLRGRSQLENYQYGASGLLNVMPEPKDVRRCDFALILRSGEVAAESINQRVESRGSPKYTADRCGHLIMWCWSRKPEDTVFEPEAEELILELATKFSKQYYCDVPLCEAGDMRIKLARLSAAAAARLYSTEDGKKLLVKKEHVEFINEFLNRNYQSRAIELDHLARDWQRRSRLSDEEEAEVRGQVKAYPGWKQAFKVISASFNNFTGTQLREQWSQEADRFIALLSSHGLLVSGGHGYKKSPALIKLIRDMLDEERGEEEDLFTPGKEQEPDF